MRIGTGFDVHRLTDGRRLVLGGVEVPFGKGLLGHSDGDVLLHAISCAIARDRGYRVVNVDSVVVAQAPKIAPYREAMRERIAGLLSIDAGMVGLKGKTTEGLGLTGRGEGIAAHAVVLMDRV